MRYAIIVEIEDDNGFTTGEIERKVHRYLNQEFDEIKHVEASEGTLGEAFGI